MSLRLMGTRLTAAAVLAWTVQASADSLYRWVDAQGHVHYSDTAPTAPVKVEHRKFNGNVVDTSGADYGTQLAVKNFPVSLYTAPDCKEVCSQARELLQRRGVPFQEISVSGSDTIAQLKKVSGGDEVPVLTVGKEMQRGFEASAFNASLDAAGYSAAGVHKPSVASKPAAAKKPADGDKAADAGASAANAGQAAGSK